MIFVLLREIGLISGKALSFEESNVNFKFCGYAELTFNESYTISIVVRPLNVAFVLT